MNMAVKVDLSPAFGPVRTQGERPTCLAFAMSDINQFHSSAPVLSAEYLYLGAAHRTPGWQPGDGTYLRHAIAVTKSPGLPEESVVPYQPDEPMLPLPALPGTGKSVFFGNTVVGGSTMNSRELTSLLVAGFPVGLVIKLTQEFFRPKGAMVGYSPMVLPNERHAVIATAAGKHQTSGEEYIRVRNSWGPDWGESGHAWLHANYINAHAVEIFRI
jgi:hypothetical protein